MIPARGLRNGSPHARRVAGAQGACAAGAWFGAGNVASCASGARRKTRQHPASPHPGGRGGARNCARN
eukprot:14041490-Alexandrium_andersonii.AAC.1